jgi:phosphatidate cytidylyltransferase
VLFASLAASWELLALARHAGMRPHAVPALAGAAAIAASYHTPAVPLAAALALASGLSLLAGLLRADVGPGAVADVAASVAAGVVPASLLGFATAIRHLEDERQVRGLLLLWLLSTTWASDAGAYYVGRALGRRKMAPSVSPKKTWEGAAGGVAGALAGSLAYGAAVWPHAATGHALAIGVVVAVLGPPGDLAESVLKRSAGVKDSGALFPGHGGILDRVDSLLLSLPVLYYYYRLAM